MADIEFELNGEVVTVSVDPTTPLRDVLRREFGLTGTKAGCMSGRCGVCTIHVDGTALKSCLVMAGKVDGKAVTTVEGLADGDDLHPLQQAFEDQFATQCGYCTPGFVMTGAAFVEEAEDPTREEIKDAIKGNVCRCTGYEKIISAFEGVSSR